MGSALIWIKLNRMEIVIGRGYIIGIGIIN